MLVFSTCKSPNIKQVLLRGCMNGTTMPIQHLKHFTAYCQNTTKKARTNRDTRPSHRLYPTCFNTAEAKCGIPVQAVSMPTLYACRYERIIQTEKLLKSKMHIL